MRDGRHTPYFDPESALTMLELIFIQNLASEADYDSTKVPLVETGSGAPSSTPGAVGSIYVDTAGDDVYIATGTASSADWTLVNGGGGGGGFTMLPATGTVNGSNLVFTFSQVPSFIVADGVWFKPVSKNGTTYWTNVSTTVTMVNPPFDDIFGVA